MAESSDRQLEEHYLRLHSLVLFSTKVLRAKFDTLFPPDKLKTWSPSDKDLKKAKLSDHQIRHVKANRDSSKFDISLLVSLLRNFCFKHDKSHPLWDELDNDKIIPSLQSEIAQIVRIRNLRNKVCDICCIVQHIIKLFISYRRHSLHRKIAVKGVLKLSIRGNKRCDNTDAPLAELYFQM